MKMNTGKTEFVITNFPDRTELVNSWITSEKYPAYVILPLRKVNKSGSLGPQIFDKVRVDSLTDYRIPGGTISFSGVFAQAKANSKYYMFNATCWPKSQGEDNFGKLFTTRSGI
jgi:hypothetical protein